MKKTFKNLIFIFCFFTAIFFLIAWNFDGKYLAGGDQAIYLYPNSYSKHIITMWDSNYNHVLGGENAFMHYLVPIPLFYKFFEFLPIVYVQYLYFAMVITATFFSSYYFFRKYLYQEFYSALVASSLYFLNLFFFVSYVNYNIHLSFIILPLLLLLAHKIIERDYKGIIIFCIFLSLTIPGAFINPPAVLPIIFIFFIYFLYLLFKQGLKDYDPKVLGSSVMAFSVLAALNLWWLAPFVYIYFFSGASETLSNINFAFFHTTSLSDTFRFLGGWAFSPKDIDVSEGRYDSLYYNVFAYVLTYGIIFLAFFSLKFWRKNKDILFFLFLSLLGIFLAKGDLPPFGELYTYAFENLPFIYMFREPYTKFMIIHVFAVSALLGYFIKYFEFDHLRLKKQVVVSITISLILIISTPFFLGGFVPSRNNEETRRTYLIEIPDYMNIYRQEVAKNSNDYNTFLLVNNMNTHLWPNGANVFEMAARPFNSKNILTYKPDYFTHTAVDTIAALHKMFKRTDPYFPKLLGFMGIGEVHWFKDVDWRYEGGAEYFNPSYIQSLVTKYEGKGINLSASISKFTRDYLRSIPNSENDNSLRNEMYVELLDKSVIDIYKVDESLVVPKIYVPEKTILVVSNPEDLYKFIYLDLPAKSEIFTQSSDERIDWQEIIITGDKPLIVYPSGQLRWKEEWSRPTPQVSPSSLEYKLVKIKERKLLEAASDTEARLNMLLWLMAKRVEELILFAPSDTTKKELLLGIADFGDQAVGIVKTLDTKNNRNSVEMAEKVYMYLGLTILELDKIGLGGSRVDKIFFNYSDWLNNLSTDAEKECRYTFKVPEAGKYKLVEIGGGGNKVVKELSLKAEDYYIPCSEIDHSETVLNIDKFDTDETNLLQQLNDWEQLGEYKLSFKYKIDKGKKIELYVLSDRNDYSAIGKFPGEIDWNIVENTNFEKRKISLIETKLTEKDNICLSQNSDCFSTYEVRFVVPPTYVTGYLSVFSDARIQELKLERREKHDLALRKTESDGELKNVYIQNPNLTFERINDSLYKVKIEGAKKPYDLVFNEQFNRNWKLLLPRSKSSPRHLLSDVVNSWRAQEIAFSQHRLVNGYANSWHITPQDTQGKESYELYIEYVPQRLGYSSMILSIIILAGALVFLII